ncbi:hypothetical protein ACUCLC_005143, partial [Escherichia coli]
ILLSRGHCTTIQEAIQFIASAQDVINTDNLAPAPEPDVHVSTPRSLTCMDKSSDYLPAATSGEHRDFICE